jgi:hypothetical protein
MPASTPHLLIDVTGHGFGHAAQVAPVAAVLRQLRPDLRLTVRSLLPAPVLHAAFGVEVALAEPAPDIGLRMAGPLDVDSEASAAAYGALHERWPETVAREAARLAALAPNLLVSDVGYTALAAAARAGVPALALSSLSWLEIYLAYCGHRPEAGRIADQIAVAYDSARAFLQLTPHLAMDGFAHRVSLPPVARLGQDRRAELLARLGLAPDTRFAVIALGGVPVAGELADLPRLPGLVWLVPEGVGTGRTDAVPAAGLALPYVDLIRSAALVVTKPGYGTFVEALANGSRLLYCARPDWPETPVLDAWARANGAAAMVSRERLQAGDYGETAAELLARPDPAPVAAAGAEAAARRILQTLDQGR